ncbi:hypothetical protein ACTVBU_10955 [Sanguibacter sp. A246]|uniref:hypothetical protein n=1 Tax=Sanguibacter sp. A246 TaxID=3457326 RepID=UPI003FD7128D
MRAVVDEALDLIYSAPTVAHSWDPSVAIATTDKTCDVLLAGREHLRAEEVLSGHTPGLEQLVDHVMQGRMWHVDRHGRVLAPMGGSPQTPWPVRVRPLNLGAESELALDAAAGLRIMTYGLQGLAAEIALCGPGEDSMGALRGVRRTVGEVLDRVHKDIRQIGPRHHDIGSRARAKCFAMIGALDWLMNCVEIEIDEDLARAVDQARLSASSLADFPSIVLWGSTSITAR